MKLKALLSITLMSYLAACSSAEEQTAFNGNVNKKAEPKAGNAEPEKPSSESSGDEQIPAEPVVAQAPAPVEAPPAPLGAIEPVSSESEQPEALSLAVKLSASEVRAGGKTIQAEAVFSGKIDSKKVTWSLEGADNIDLGQIDQDGLYKSPAAAANPIDVTIVATSEADPALVGKKPLKVIPADQLFVGCKKGNVTFPIAADVFQLPAGIQKLPDFSTMTRADLVCLDKFDIPLQGWEAGFPGSPHLQEWFGLRSKVKLIVPQSGNYQFRLYSDDGSKLFINGTKIIDNDGQHSATAKDGAAELSLGKQEVVLEYFQGPRTHVALQLFWKTPGSSSWVIVPTSAFTAN